MAIGIASKKKSVITLIHAWNIVFMYSLEQMLDLGGADVHSASTAMAKLSSAT